MRKLPDFNSPRGLAGNAAQIPRPSNVFPITKNILPPVVVPVKTAFDKFTDKGKES